MVESSMKYSMIPEAGGPIKRHCNGELYLALEMENLSLTDGYAVQPVPWRQSVDARDAGRLKSQFMRSAKLPKRRCRRPPASLVPASWWLTNRPKHVLQVKSCSAGHFPSEMEAAGISKVTYKRPS